MTANRRFRLLNNDGTFNIERKGYHRVRVSDLYHSLLTLHWSEFVLLVVVTYLSINVLFAALYYLCGANALRGSESSGYGVSRFLDCFFFSVQTLATIGYGKLTPSGIAANLVVTCESLAGLLGFAVATGLLFARFSRPTARVIFSNKAVINHQDGVQSFVFRIANQRVNQIVDAEVSVSVSRTETTKEGETFRNFYNLRLERSKTPIFVLSWSVVHSITPESPFYGLSTKDLLESEAEILVTLNGIDDTFSQNIHARHSYVPEEIHWDKTFTDILARNDGGQVTLDLSGFHEIKDVKRGG